MNFDYNEEQQLLADSVRRYLEKQYDFEARRKIVAGAGWSEQAWRTYAELGLTGLPLPADYGGFGGGAVDLMGIMEALGEALAVEPYLPTVLGALCVARGASEQQKKAILPKVVDGSLRLAFAHAGTRAVVGASVAQKWVVAEKSALFLVDASATKPFRTLDGMLAADIGFSSAKAERLEGGSALIEELTDFATALVCAEAVGVMKSACEETLEYLKTRKQFGAPIGTFQALQHRIVDMYISLEQARSMACLACSKADHAKEPRERARAISAAKIRVSDAARHVSQEAVQLHGGMGMAEELKVSHSFRRLTVIAQQFGDADHHLARFASL